MVNKSSVGRVDCKPQQGHWGKHSKLEYKLLCLQDIMAYNLEDYVSAEGDLEMDNSTNCVYSIKMNQY